jgi:hypothetical protein
MSPKGLAGASVLRVTMSPKGLASRHNNQLPLFKKKRIVVIKERISFYPKGYTPLFLRERRGLKPD